MCNYDKMCPNDMEMWWSETIIKILLAPNLNRRGLIFQGRLTRFYEPKLRWKRSSKSHKFSSEQTFESDKKHGQVWKWNITVWLSAVLEPNGPWWYLWCHFEGILAWECRKLGKISQSFYRRPVVRWSMRDNAMLLESSRAVCCHCAVWCPVRMIDTSLSFSRR